MLFTIITIVFLPLSFFTGLFGMNATNLTGSTGPGLYNWGDIFRFMSTTPFAIFNFKLPTDLHHSPHLRLHNNLFPPPRLQQACPCLPLLLLQRLLGLVNHLHARLYKVA